MNTALATGLKQLGPGFYAWRAFCNSTPDLDVGGLIAGVTPILTEGERRAYDAPFPDATYKAGVRSFPNLVCDKPDAPGAGAW
jgi:haloalkane dehalogenase/tRNA(adenine34) deaminase